MAQILAAKLGALERVAAAEQSQADAENMVTFPCPCGRTEHRESALYCVDCGTKLERAAANDPLLEMNDLRN